ncbi:hypothetical protein [Peribacillus butanolivorans]
MEKEIGFSDIFSIKTFFEIIGTLLGSFLGAYIAGKYAVKVMKEQIEYDKEKDKLNRLEISLKIIKYISNGLYEGVEAVKEFIHNSYEEEIDKQEIFYAEKYMKTLFNKLDKLNLSEIDISIYENIQRIYDLIEGTLNSIDMIKMIEKGENIPVLFYDYSKILDMMYEDIEEVEYYYNELLNISESLELDIKKIKEK